MFDRSLPAPASVYAMHTFTVPAHAAGDELGALRVGPERDDGRRDQHRGGVDERRVVVRGLVARPPPASSAAGRRRRARRAGSRPRMPASPAAAQHLAFERLVPAGEVGAVLVAGRTAGAIASTRNARTSARNAVELGVERGGRAARAPIRAAQRRRGRPSPRWAMRLRWISLVPP